VYVIFEDGTDLYWARSRVLEYLSRVLPRLPEGVSTELGPDATGVGWVYQYALVDRTGRRSLDELRGVQDWFLRYQLQSVPGVAEIASIGGFQKQYQVEVNPHALAAYGIPLDKVVQAVRQSNNDVGGRVIEFAGAEYMIRGRGYVRGVEDLEQVVVGSSRGGTPVLVRNVARVATGPEMRRGVSDLDGQGDTVGGIVVMRHGENALAVIDRVKERLRELQGSLPEGVEVLATYDRSDLIRRAIATLRRTLAEEMAIVSLVILLFLWHLPSAIVPILTIPVAVALSFIPMYWAGLTSNIMSLAGIAISIGVLVDGVIVEMENAYKKLEHWESSGRHGDFHRVRLDAMLEVGPSVFFSLLVVAVSFIPIFTLVDQEGRLFKPLAFTKNFTMFIAAFLALTLDPALRMLFTRVDAFAFRPRWLAQLATHALVGRYYPEEAHPISRRVFAVYEPACRFVLRHGRAALGAAAVLIGLAGWGYTRLGREFMPPLNEGVILYMPTTLPGLSVTQAQELMQRMDELLKEFPEVERVFGKAGRADTSTDPAPFSMMETIVVLKPQDRWRPRERWYSALPELLQGPLRHLWPDRIAYDDLVQEMDAKLRFPGVVNAWTMPIKNRVDMLSTGIRTPVGVKIFGRDLAEIERLGLEIEARLRDLPGTRSVYAERVGAGYFLDFDLRRERLARYGLSVADAQAAIVHGLGGEVITTAIEGRERYSVNVRYAREFRDDIDALKRVLVATPGGAQVPLTELAELVVRQGPAMIRNENGLLSGYVYLDVAGRDVGSYVRAAKERLAGLKVPTGYALQWSGQYENMERVRERLTLILPATLLLIVFLLHLNTRSWVKTGIVLLAVPFSLIGAIGLLWLLDYNVSIAVWVGLIALMGLDAETGVFMLLFLDLSYDEAVREGRMRSREDLVEAVVHGAVRRARPKLMTVLASMLGLVPILWSMGTGADVMKRVAAPMVGGLASSFLLELLLYPVIFFYWKWRTEVGPAAAAAALARD
ncbi:MAG: efflux RND transporter permease subunit, partial [Elusimicrobia bacterium]|nr:efflux RND transporter permease subunit [Elusimicrobiota bacterium]